MNTILASASAMLSDERKRAIPIILLALLGAIFFAYWNSLAGLWSRWGAEEELSHSYFLPLVAGWMLWERRNALLNSIGAPDWTGFVPAAGGLVFLLIGEMINVDLVAQLGFVILLMGLPIILGGRSLGLLFFVPLAYLFFMVPPPYMAINMLSWKFQLMSSELGVWMIRLFDIPVFLAGNVIHLTSTKLEVVEACSGLRYLFPFLSLGALAAYFYKGPMWHRALIFLSTIPITILMNSFRIALTGVLMEKFGGNHTEGFLHLFEGWVVFVMCIGFLFLVIWVLTLLRGKKTPLAFVGFEEVDPVTPKAPFALNKFVRNGIIITLLVMVTGIFAHMAGNRPVVIPERQTLGTLPLEFPGWRTRETQLSPETIVVLGADDYLLTDMLGPEGENINLYIAYLEARRDGKSWHSPMQCLPGGGWEVVSQEIVPTQRVDGSRYYHTRMIIQQDQDQRLVYYWYDQRGRKVANEFMMRFWVMWDDLIKRRSDGAMIRLMTQVRPDETLEDAEARLNEMRLDLEPKLPAYIPH